MVAAVGEVMVSSDHLLRCGGDAVEAVESVYLLAEAVELEESIRKGMRRLERKEVKLSFRLRMDFERLSLRGR